MAAGANQTYPIRLEVRPVQIEGLTVAPVEGAVQRDLGRQVITPEMISSSPIPAASGDLATYLQTMPGVVAAGDRGGQLYIRGGTHTENLSLVDGMLIYQPFHIIGFFSAFAEDLISTVDFYAGGFGARYSSRTSSVLDVRLRDGNRTSYEGSGSVSPFLAEMMAEGPAGSGGKASWLVSARKSLLEQTSSTFIGEKQPIGFESQLVKFSSIGDDGTRCSLFALRTADSGRMDPADEISRVGWRNFVSGGHCIQLFGDVLRLLEVNAGFSSVHNEAISRGASALRSDTRRYQMDVNTTNLYRGVPFEVGYFARLEEMKYNFGTVRGFQEESSYLWSLGGYAEVAARFGDKILIQPGVVVSASQPKGVEPRLRASWNPLGSEDQELTAAVGLYKQAVAGLTDTRDASAVFVAWDLVPGATATSSLHAQLAWQQKLSSGIRWSLEGYYRGIQDVAVPVWNTTAQFNTELSLADGTVYGADGRVEYTRPGFYGFVGYGYSRTEYKAAQEQFNFWFNEPVQRYHPPHDRRHQLNALGSVDAGPFTFAARWQLGTGLPFTRPMGYDETFDYRFTIQSIVGNRGDTRMIVEKPYLGRLPITHRLDLSLERTFAASLRGDEGAGGCDQRVRSDQHVLLRHLFAPAGQISYRWRRMPHSDWKCGSAVRPFSSVLVVILSLAVSGCDADFQPLIPHEPLFSMYGMLEVGADTQWIRVMPVRDSVFTRPEPLDAAVTLEDLGTGRVVQLRDSIVHHRPVDSNVTSDLWAHNFWTTEPIVAGSTYRISAVSSQGARTSAIVKTPRDPERIVVNFRAPLAFGGANYRLRACLRD